MTKTRPILPIGLLRRSAGILLVERQRLQRSLRRQAVPVVDQQGCPFAGFTERACDALVVANPHSGMLHYAIYKLA